MGKNIYHIAVRSESVGKFILCSGEEAKHPYLFRLTNKRIYSIEELCYYLYQNIYVITEDIFNTELLHWLEEEIEMSDLAEELRKMLRNRNGLKDIIVAILCSADYYDEKEINGLVEIMDKINNLPKLGRQKIKADNLLRYHKFTEAAIEYEMILQSEEADQLSCENYGNIMHNLAIAHIHTASLRSAAIEFKEAYSRNRNEESLKEYIFALTLTKEDDQLKQEAEYFGISDDKMLEYMSELKDKLMDAEKTKNYKNVLRLSELKKEGRVTEYYGEIDKMIFQWKEKYKAKG